MYAKFFLSKFSHAPLTKILAGALSLFLLTFLMSYALLRQDQNADVLKRIQFWLVPVNDVAISSTTEGCTSTNECYSFLKNRANFRSIKAESDHLDLSAEIPSSQKNNGFVLMRFKVDLSGDILSRIEEAIAFSLPDMNYKKADVYWNNHFEKRTFGGERSFLTIDKDLLHQGESTIELLLEIEPSDASTAVNWQEPFFFASNGEYKSYMKQLTLKQLGQGEQIGMIARVALAALMLLFFVILDGSESALGLSLAMGFEAAGMCFGNVSLKHQWISTAPFWHVTKLTFYTLSDFVSLYFLLYISGRKRFSIWFWIAIGTVVGLGYGSAMDFYPEIFPNVSSFWIPRILLTVGVGIVFCVLAVIKSLRAKERDVWKTVAMLLAIAGMGIVVLEPIGSMIPGFDDNQDITTIMSIGKAIKAYVLALSGLAAIASMRKELRLMETEREKARKMAHELQLGREMQESLLQIPVLPEGIDVSASHVAAAYVSGDTYFFDWNSSNQVMTVILNDVPGHGLQAALKAFACNVIAKTIWSQGKITNDRRKTRSLFPVYQEQVVEMLKHQNDAMPFNAFTGIELFIAQQKAVVYRSNYNEAIVITPKADGAEIMVLSCRSGDFSEVPLVPGSCFLLVSDGLIPTSKVQKQFVEQLRVAFKGDEHLAQGTLTAQDILNVLLDPQKIKLNLIDDDKTIIVLRWTGRRMILAA